VGSSRISNQNSPRQGTDANGNASATEIEWPGFQTTASHSRAPTQLQTLTWFGSVLEGQRDAGGQMYMRNRYYDPATGQFTQTDPIGLGGGWNTYGFANGDPVSYSDPYGLSADTATSKKDDLSVTIVRDDGSFEIRTGGTKAWRNNNPGNLVYGPFAREHGAIGRDWGGFAIFGDDGDGARAQEALLRTGTYHNISLDSTISLYAPPCCNDTRRYQELVRGATGASGGTLLRQLSPTQMQSLLAKMREHEGYRPGKIIKG
jgi:RHS repeat-associated protein